MFRWRHSVAVLLLGLAAHAAAAADWPQLQCTPQRTGYTADSVEPPFKVAWTADFHRERVARDVQAVIYDGKVIVGTKAGTLYALGATDGREAWKFACGGPIVHTAACADGKVVVGSLDGAVYAVDAKTGQQVWRFSGEPGYGFSTAPAIAEGSIFIGQRGGTFYALRLEDGKLLWQFAAGAPILNSAAWDAGKVFFCDERLYLHCLDAATGKEIWRSEQLYGQSALQYHPVVYRGYVLIRPMMTHPCPQYATVRQPRPQEAFQGSYPPEPVVKAFLNWWYGPAPTFDPPKITDDMYPAPYLRWLAEASRTQINIADVRAGKMPKVLLDEQEAMVSYFRAHPYDQDLFVLSEATGKQAFIAPHFPSVFSNAGNAPPPVVDGRGDTVVIPWVFFTPGWARLDLTKQRVVELIPPPRISNTDENMNASVGGRMLFMMHCSEVRLNFTGAFDLERKEFYPLPAAPEGRTLLADNILSGNNSASIAGGYFYHITWNQLAAWTHREEGKP